MSSPLPDSQETETTPPPSSAGGARYYPVSELQALTEEELQALWDEIPPERQKFYEQAYETALSSLGSGDVTDDAALGIIEQILAHYGSGQVPIMTGNRWVQVPVRVRQAVERGEELTAEAPEPAAKRKPGARPAPARPGAKRKGPSAQLIVAAVLFTILLICLASVLIRRFTGDRAEEVTETPTGEAVATETPTPTATPINIENADRIIRDGTNFRDYYPVLLEVQPSTGSPRVMVVQQKPVEIADWAYEPRNTDVASWIAGLLVRPVLGLPYSDENARLMNNLDANDTILLHMSTGTVLQFKVENKVRVDRQDTSIFRQVSPGIVLVLLGETTEPDRLVIFGYYPPEQELLRDDVALSLGGASTVLREGETATLDESGATIKVLDSYTSLGEVEGELPETLAYLFVDIVLEAGTTPLDTGRLLFDVVDSTGVRYNPIVFSPTLSNHPPLTPQQLPAENSVTATIGYYVPRSIAPTATFNVRVGTGSPVVTYILNYDPPSSLVMGPPEVAVISVKTRQPASGQNQLIVTARIFNPNKQPLNLRPEDFYVIFSPNDPGRGVFPVGPQSFASTYNGEPFPPPDIAGGQALDLELRFNWDLSAFAGIYILEYRYVAQLR